jgi:CBS domain-containing protein
MVIGPDATLQDAAKRMREHDVGAVAVCDGDRLVGLLTERDLAIRAMAEGQDPTVTKVRDVMTSHLVSCCEHEDVGAAIRLMQAEQIRALVVLDHQQRLVGVVSLEALAVLSGDETLAGSANRWPA